MIIIIFELENLFNTNLITVNISQNDKQSKLTTFECLKF